jgi:hypothetical protein
VWKSSPRWYAECNTGWQKDSTTVTNRKAANVAIAKDILRYFLRNPNAADSLSEIARWRLMQETVRRTVEETRDALDWLTEQGYLSEESRVGTESLFQLDRARLEDATRFAAETGSSDGLKQAGEHRG